MPVPAKTGDVNVDGVSDSVDALLVLQYSAGLSGLPIDPELWHPAADVNCDLVVNAMDGTLILQAHAGLIDLRM